MPVPVWHLIAPSMYSDGDAQSRSVCDLTVVSGLLFPPHSGLFWGTWAAGNTMNLSRVFLTLVSTRMIPNAVLKLNCSI